MSFNNLIWIIAPLTIFATAGHAQQLTARVDRSGFATVKQSDGTPPILTIKVGIYESDWQSQTATAGIQSGDVIIKCPKANTTIQGSVTYSIAETDSRTLVVTAVLTPLKPVSVNSVHVSASFPTSDWVGGKASIGDLDVPLPLASQVAGLVPSQKGNLTLTNKQKSIFVSTRESVLLQDNRTLGSNTLEVRAGPQTPSGSIWPKGESRTIQLMVRLEHPVRIIQDRPLTIIEGEDWIPINVTPDVKVGSALDFRKLFKSVPTKELQRLHVSKQGFLTRDDKTPVRLFGTNLCFDANYLEKLDVDRLVKLLSATGYNALRIHHYDNLLEVDGYQERLDYLVATCKQAGIVIKLDLYVSRSVPGYTTDMFKAAILLRQDAMDDWKNFAKKLLTHVNRYTNMAWKDDPAIAIISMVNESNLTNSIQNLTPSLNVELIRLWDAWRTRKNLPPAKLPTSALDRDASGRELGAFLADVHSRAYATMSTFLKKEIGTKALLTDMNGKSEAAAFQHSRLAFDLVDMHMFWDHPTFNETSWQLPSTGANNGFSAVYGGGSGPTQLAPKRILNKPFIVSEWNFAAPNRYRYEAGILTAATASIQGWDGIFRFAWSHSRETTNAPKQISYFDVASDPTALASERVAALLYRRGDLTTPTVTVARMLPETSLTTNFSAPLPGEFPALALVSRIGIRIQNGVLSPPLPTELRLENSGDTNAIASMLRAELLPNTNKTSLDNEFRQSITNQIFLDGPAGNLRVVGPHAVAGIGTEGDMLKFGSVDVDVEGTGALVAAVSLESAPVTSSKHLLLVHATDSQNADTRFFSSDQRILESWGKPLILARQGTALFTISRVQKPKQVKVYRLDPLGNRAEEVEADVDENIVKIQCVVAPEGKASTFYYEVVITDRAPVPVPKKTLPKQVKREQTKIRPSKP